MVCCEICYSTKIDWSIYMYTHTHRGGGEDKMGITVISCIPLTELTLHFNPKPWGGKLAIFECEGGEVLESNHKGVKWILP